jgi:tripartite ATP-independent transporter DctM subunit
MPIAETLAVLMVVAVCLLLMVGYPVALTLSAVALAFACLGSLSGVMDLALLGALPQRIFGVMTNEVLLAIPLFIFMGVTLERSRIAEQLLEAMGRLFGPLPGGLAISVTLVGALLAAAKGVVGATAVTMALITLPTMLRYGYDRRLAAGTVAATATLAQIMPPATVLVLLGDQLNASYQAAQLSQGKFAPDSVSVSDLFAGAIVPALMLVGLYVLFQVGVAILKPGACPPVEPQKDPATGLGLAPHLAEALAAPVLLIVVVLGSILGGIATPSEAAAVGAFGALLLTARRLGPDQRWPTVIAVISIATALVLRMSLDRWIGRAGLIFQLGTLMAYVLMVPIAIGTIAAIIAVWRTGILQSALSTTTQMTSMIFTILIGATLFSLVFRGLGGDGMVQHALSDLPGGPGVAVVVVMAAMFLLGFVMDAFEIIFVVVPIVAPALLTMPSVDPIWLGVMMAMNLQMSYMHPPLGPTLFYLRGAAPPEISTLDIYLGIIPFVAIQMAALLLLWFVPSLATWLPGVLFGG